MEVFTYPRGLATAAAVFTMTDERPVTVSGNIRYTTSTFSRTQWFTHLMPFAGVSVGLVARISLSAASRSFLSTICSAAAHNDHAPPVAVIHDLFHLQAHPRVRPYDFRLHPRGRVNVNIRFVVRVSDRHDIRLVVTQAKCPKPTRRSSSSTSASGISNISFIGAFSRPTILHAFLFVSFRNSGSWDFQPRRHSFGSWTVSGSGFSSRWVVVCSVTLAGVVSRSSVV